jgi:hypothetical protein
VLLSAAGGVSELELLCSGLLLGAQQRIEVLGNAQPLDELPLLCAAMRPAALVIRVQGPVSPALAARLRGLQLEIACPMALLGDGLAEFASLLQGIPLALLEGRAPRPRPSLRPCSGAHWSCEGSAAAPLFQQDRHEFSAAGDNEAPRR